MLCNCQLDDKGKITNWCAEHLWLREMVALAQGWEWGRAGKSWEEVKELWPLRGKGADPNGA